ncbi:hypothetical protein [Frondihabitans australicus]|uniref:Uncharacterized protein n=1 Tax=Frondihabitans australicus TaxID=386892 RepID=A0A495IE05_9MICO|nr:hypothetical protein [Frondihabitans australicus]RKR73571.1 hypothetical protein C8E83_0664 [Frondihabitans australicus]
MSDERPQAGRVEPPTGGLPVAPPLREHYERERNGIWIALASLLIAALALLGGCAYLVSTAFPTPRVAPAGSEISTLPCVRWVETDSAPNAIDVPALSLVLVGIRRTCSEAHIDAIYDAVAAYDQDELGSTTESGLLLTTASRPVALPHDLQVDPEHGDEAWLQTHVVDGLPDADTFHGLVTSWLWIREHSDPRAGLTVYDSPDTPQATVTVNSAEARNALLALRKPGGSPGSAIPGGLSDCDVTIK